MAHIYPLPIPKCQAKAGHWNPRAGSPKIHNGAFLLKQIRQSLSHWELSSQIMGITYILIYIYTNICTMVRHVGWIKPYWGMIAMVISPFFVANDVWIPIGWHIGSVLIRSH